LHIIRGGWVGGENEFFLLRLERLSICKLIVMGGILRFKKKKEDRVQGGTFYCETNWSEKENQRDGADKNTVGAGRERRQFLRWDIERANQTNGGVGKEIQRKGGTNRGKSKRVGRNDMEMLEGERCDHQTPKP